MRRGQLLSWRHERSCCQRPGAAHSRAGADGVAVRFHSPARQALCPGVPWAGMVNLTCSARPAGTMRTPPPATARTRCPHCLRRRSRRGCRARSWATRPCLVASERSVGHQLRLLLQSGSASRQRRRRQRGVELCVSTESVEEPCNKHVRLQLHRPNAHVSVVGQCSAAPQTAHCWVVFSCKSTQMCPGGLREAAGAAAACAGPPVSCPHHRH